MGHTKLNIDAVEQDFGLRVVLNSVDPERLRSADVRTPDENTISRRTQTSRGSDQTAFDIDVERDLVRGLAGVPKNAEFGSNVAGTDSLTLTRSLAIDELPAVCAEVLDVYQRLDYKESFAWVDQIRHERNQSIIDVLNDKLVQAFRKAQAVGSTDSLYLAFPVIYDPEKLAKIAYTGFRSLRIHQDLDIDSFVEDLNARGREFSAEDLVKITVCEVDDRRNQTAGKWKLRDCVVFETQYMGLRYVLSSGRWYKVDADLANEVREFFERASQFPLPFAEEDEQECEYNERIAHTDSDLICLDRKLIKPAGARSPIEICDILTRQRHLIHVKDEVSSSKLSHLFNQGTVSAQVLANEACCRDLVNERISIEQQASGKAGFEGVIPQSQAEFKRSDFTVVYAVITKAKRDSLPFFSLVSFRQAARNLEGLGFRFAFGWIERRKG